MIKSKNLKPHESKAQSQITGLFGKGNTQKYRHCNVNIKMLSGKPNGRRYSAAEKVNRVEQSRFLGVSLQRII